MRATLRCSRAMCAVRESTAAWQALAHHAGASHPSQGLGPYTKNIKQLESDIVSHMKKVKELIGE